MKHTTQLKNLINSPDILVLPCCHDGISAKVYEQEGFPALCAASFGISGSLLGQPDIGLMSGMETVRQYENICSTVNIPVFVDIDTGYGDVNNVIRMVKECEKAGAAGIFIEDQTWPKKSGHFEGKHILDLEEFVPKLRAAMWAKTDPDFVIMAGTDAVQTQGLSEGIRRAEIYGKLGCDVVMVEAVTSIEEMRQVNQALSKAGIPSFINMVEGGKTPMLPADELQAIGYDVVAYTASSLFTTVKAVRDMADTLVSTGTTESVLDRMVSFEAYFDFIGANEIRSLEESFMGPVTFNR